MIADDVIAVHVSFGDQTDNLFIENGINNIQILD